MPKAAKKKSIRRQERSAGTREAILAAAAAMWLAPGTAPILRRWSAAWVGLVFVQFFLGACTIWTNKAADIATAHVATGALTLVLGALPLAIGIGQGASLRQPLGITVMGGLILSQVFTLYTTPVIYLFFDELAAKVAAHRQKRKSRRAARHRPLPEGQSA